MKSSAQINCFVQFLIVLVAHYSNDNLTRIRAKKIESKDP
jgi:hypothetical protein